jgi:hypothetical protein
MPTEPIKMPLKVAFSALIFSICVLYVSGRSLSVWRPFVR